LLIVNILNEHKRMPLRRHWKAKVKGIMNYSLEEDLVTSALSPDPGVSSYASLALNEFSDKDKGGTRIQNDQT
jgi:hypothetical protein